MPRKFLFKSPPDVAVEADNCLDAVAELPLRALPTPSPSTQEMASQLSQTRLHLALTAQVQTALYFQFVAHAPYASFVNPA